MATSSVIPILIGALRIPTPFTLWLRTEHPCLTLARPRMHPLIYGPVCGSDAFATDRTEHKHGRKQETGHERVAYLRVWAQPATERQGIG